MPQLLVKVNFIKLIISAQYKNEDENSDNKMWTMTQRLMKSDKNSNGMQKMRETWTGVKKSPCLNSEPLDPVSSVVNKNWPSQKRIRVARIMPLNLTQKSYQQTMPDEDNFIKIECGEPNISIHSKSNWKKNSITAEQNSLMKLTQYSNFFN